MVTELEVKVCPECGGDLIVNNLDGGALTCTVCGLVVDSEPVLLPGYDSINQSHVFLKGMTAIAPAMKSPKYWKLRSLQAQEASKAWYETHREQCKAQMKAWRETHREQCKANRKRGEG